MNIVICKNHMCHTVYMKHLEIATLLRQKTDQWLPWAGEGLGIACK